MPERPLALLAFADDRSRAPRILAALEPERSALGRVFEPRQQAGDIDVRVSDGGAASLIQDLQDIRSRLLLFHFAGHANGQSLHLEQQPGQGQFLAASNLVSLLRDAPGLRLVFLNACATRDQVQALLDAGIPAVIATARDIGDSQARTFSETFYRGLLNGASLQGAFEDARIGLESSQSQPRVFRSLVPDDDEPPAPSFPWGLYCPNPADGDWRLADAPHDALRNRLRAGTRRRYQELRGPGERFEHLDISEVLLTSARSQLIETDVKLGEERLGRRESVEKLWTMKPPHSIVLGDGGMGKTVSLLRLWERFLEDEQGPIPIFVQLNEFNQATTQNREHWLTWYIARHYLGKRRLPEETEQQLWSWLEADWDRPYPKLILLLDGFNEISVDTRALLVEFQQEWRHKAKGIQILLSSRYGNNLTWAEDFQKLELQPLDEARAEAYLQALGLPWPGPEQPDLRRLICNPMMLTLYAATSEFMRQEKGRADGFKPNASTGELMWNFIHAQTLKFEALHSIEEEQVHLYRWLIWHLLPWIGYEMEQRGLFSLTEEELLKLIQAYPAIIAPEDRWAYKKLFKDADRQWRSLGTGISEAQAWTYYDTLTQTLRLFRPEGEDLAFLHQNFRDFFAALHIRNSLVLDVDRQRPPGLLIPRALSIYLRRMLGEIEGEHHNAARLEGRRWTTAHQQPTLLTRALDGCRGLHGPQRPGLAVFNLLEMIHEVRGEWTGVELNELDLYGIPLNSRFIRSSTSILRLTGSLLNKLLLFLHREKKNVHVVSYSPDGKRLILGFSNGSISEWDSETGACLRQIKGHSGPVRVLVYRPDGLGFLSAERESGTIKEWDAHTGTCIRTFEGHSGGVLCIAFHPSKNRFISGSSDRSIMEWDILTGVCIRSYLGINNERSVRFVAYSPSGKQIISSVGGSINIWDTESGFRIESHYWELKVRDITSIDYNPNRNSLLAGLDCQGQFGGLAELLLESGRMGQTFRGHRYIRAVTIRADGEKFLSGSYAGTIKEWSYSSEFPIKHFGAVGDSVWSLAYHPDGKRFVSGQKNGIAKEWDSAIGLSTKTFGGYFNEVQSIAFHPNGRHFIVASPDGSIKQWDCIAGVCVRIIEGHNTSTLDLAYRQDGKGFISGAEDGTISEWESETGICIRTFKAEPTWNLKLLSHPDGNGIITVYPRSIKEWDPSNGTCLSITEEYTNHQVVTCSSDGGRYFSATGSMIKEWDPATGACIRTFKGHKHSINSVAYRPDGKRILSGSDDGTIKEWDPATGECLRTFHNIPGLNVQGWDFRGAVHDFTEKDIELLRMYGAIFSPEDEARWQQIMAEEDAYYAERA